MVLRIFIRNNQSFLNFTTILFLDINECDRKPCATNATCTNNAGSFTCKCNAGFSGTGKVCADIDECAATPKPCSITPLVTCTNSIGSYKCGACPTGYSGNGATCAGWYSTILFNKSFNTVSKIWHPTLSRWHTTLTPTPPVLPSFFKCKSFITT